MKHVLPKLYIPDKPAYMLILELVVAKATPSCDLKLLGMYLYSSLSFLSLLCSISWQVDGANVLVDLVSMPLSVVGRLAAITFGTILLPLLFIQGDGKHLGTLFFTLSFLPLNLVNG